MTNEDAIYILLNSNEYHHAKGDLPHSAASIEAFNKAIAALKAERPKGEWIVSGLDYQCSNCGMVPCFRQYNFCPDCGADMRDNKNETTFDDYLNKQLKDPEFKKEWEKLCDEDKEKGDVE